MAAHSFPRHPPIFRRKKGGRLRASALTRFFPQFSELSCSVVKRGTEKDAVHGGPQFSEASADFSPQKRRPLASLNLNPIFLAISRAFVLWFQTGNREGRCARRPTVFRGIRRFFAAKGGRLRASTLTRFSRNFPSFHAPLSSGEPRRRTMHGGPQFSGHPLIFRRKRRPLASLSLDTIFPAISRAFILWFRAGNREGRCARRPIVFRGIRRFFAAKKAAACEPQP